MTQHTASSSTSAPLRIFYDGACPLCSREMDHYKRLPDGARLGYIDIAAPEFDARAYGLSPEAVQRELHVLTEDGKVLRGVDAFGAIWTHLPRYKLLVPLTRLPVSRQVMQLGYAIFARLRPHLPGRKAEASGACSITKPKRPSADGHACSIATKGSKTS